MVVDNSVAAIPTAAMQTPKDIVQFNLNTKRFTANPSPQAILTMQLSPHLPGLQDYFDGHYFFFLRNIMSVYKCMESQSLIQGLQPLNSPILNQTAPQALIWKSIYYLLISLQLNTKIQNIWDHSWLLEETQELSLQGSQARPIIGLRQGYIYEVLWQWYWITL